MLPRPPWYAKATRRLALVRIGLPTLLAVVFAAAGPGVASSAPTRAADQVAGLVTRTTAGAVRALDPPPGGRRPEVEDDKRNDRR